MRQQVKHVAGLRTNKEYRHTFFLVKSLENIFIGNGEGDG
jgi:hypothetical protein